MAYSGKKNDEEQEVAKQNIRRIAHFVRENGFSSEEWPAYKAKDGKYLVVGENGGEVTIGREPPFGEERFRLWQEVNESPDDILEDFAKSAKNRIEL